MSKSSLIERSICKTKWYLFSVVAHVIYVNKSSERMKWYQTRHKCVLYGCTHYVNIDGKKPKQRTRCIQLYT